MLLACMHTIPCMPKTAVPTEAAPPTDLTGLNILPGGRLLLLFSPLHFCSSPIFRGARRVYYSAESFFYSRKNSTCAHTTCGQREKDETEEDEKEDAGGGCTTLRGGGKSWRADR
eukprot:4132423-Pyramimonas_sp.AAC.1